MNCQIKRTNSSVTALAPNGKESLEFSKYITDNNYESAIDKWALSFNQDVLNNYLDGSYDTINSLISNNVTKEILNELYELENLLPNATLDSLSTHLNNTYNLPESIIKPLAESLLNNPNTISVLYPDSNISLPLTPIQRQLVIDTNNNYEVKHDIIKPHIDTYERVLNDEQLLPDTNEYSALLNETRTKLNRILGNRFDLQPLVNELHTKLNNNEITYGYFQDSTIVLSREGMRNNEIYHEAFHAVFRTLLSSNQVRAYLNEARTRYNLTEEQRNNRLKQLQQQHAHMNLTQQQLEDLMYEELMAEEYKTHTETTELADSWIESIFNLIKNFIKTLLGNRTQIDSLFHKINNRRFRLSFNKQNFLKPMRVYSTQLNVGVTKDSITNKIVPMFADSSLVNKVFNRAKAHIYNKFSSELLSINKETSIDEFVDFKQRVKNELNNYFDELKNLYKNQVQKLNTDTTLSPEQKTARKAELTKHFNIYKNDDNRAAIYNELSQTFKQFSKNPFEDDYENTSETDQIIENEKGDDIVISVDAESFEMRDRSAINIGGFNNVDGQLRMFFSLLSTQEIDELTGQTYQKSVDGSGLYNVLTQALKNKRFTPESFIDELKGLTVLDGKYSSDGTAGPITALYNMVVQVTNYGKPYFNNNNQFLRLLMKTFTTNSINYKQQLIDPETRLSRLFLSNHQNTKQQIVKEWGDKHTANRLRFDNDTELVQMINDSGVISLMTTLDSDTGKLLATNLTKEQYNDLRANNPEYEGKDDNYIRNSIIKSIVISSTEIADKINDSYINQLNTNFTNLKLRVGKSVDELNKLITQLSNNNLSEEAVTAIRDEVKNKVYQLIDDFLNGYSFDSATNERIRVKGFSEISGISMNESYMLYSIMDLIKTNSLELSIQGNTKLTASEYAGKQHEAKMLLDRLFGPDSKEILFYNMFNKQKVQPFTMHGPKSNLVFISDYMSRKITPSEVAAISYLLNVNTVDADASALLTALQDIRDPFGRYDSNKGIVGNLSGLRKISLPTTLDNKDIINVFNNKSTISKTKPLKGNEFAASTNKNTHINNAINGIIQNLNDSLVLNKKRINELDDTTTLDNTLVSAHSVLFKGDVMVSLGVIAENDAKFRLDMIDLSFQNANNDRIYSVIKPSYDISTVNALRDSVVRKVRTANKPHLKGNILLTGKLSFDKLHYDNHNNQSEPTPIIKASIDDTFSNTSFIYGGDVRQTKVTDFNYAGVKDSNRKNVTSNTEDAKGSTSKNLDRPTLLISSVYNFVSRPYYTEGTKELTDINNDKKSSIEYKLEKSLLALNKQHKAPYYLTVYSNKNTDAYIELPVGTTVTLPNQSDKEVTSSSVAYRSFYDFSFDTVLGVSLNDYGSAAIKTLFDSEYFSIIDNGNKIIESYNEFIRFKNTRHSISFTKLNHNVTRNQVYIDSFTSMYSNYVEQENSNGNTPLSFKEYLLRLKRSKQELSNDSEYYSDDTIIYSKQLDMIVDDMLRLAHQLNYLMTDNNVDDGTKTKATKLFNDLSMQSLIDTVSESDVDNYVNNVDTIYDNANSFVYDKVLDIIDSMVSSDTDVDTNSINDVLSSYINYFDNITNKLHDKFEVQINNDGSIKSMGRATDIFRFKNFLNSPYLKNSNVKAVRAFEERLKKVISDYNTALKNLLNSTYKYNTNPNDVELGKQLANSKVEFDKAENTIKSFMNDANNKANLKPMFEAYMINDYFNTLQLLAKNNNIPLDVFNDTTGVYDPSVKLYRIKRESSNVKLLTSRYEKDANGDYVKDENGKYISKQDYEDITIVSQLIDGTHILPASIPSHYYNVVSNGIGLNTKSIHLYDAKSRITIAKNQLTLAVILSDTVNPLKTTDATLSDNDKGTRLMSLANIPTILTVDNPNSRFNLLVNTLVANDFETLEYRPIKYDADGKAVVDAKSEPLTLNMYEVLNEIQDFFSKLYSSYGSTTLLDYIKDNPNDIEEVLGDKFYSMFKRAESYYKASQQFSDPNYKLTAKTIQKIVDSISNFYNDGFYISNTVLSSNRADVYERVLFDMSVNTFVYTNAYTDLIDGDPRTRSNSEDKVKRNAGGLGYGDSLGEGKFKVSYWESVNDKVLLNNESKVDLTDGQAYLMDVRFFDVQSRIGRMPEQVSDIYLKIRLGDDISFEETNVLEAYKASMNSVKGMYYSGDVYHKLSFAILNKAWIAKLPRINKELAKDLRKQIKEVYNQIKKNNLPENKAKLKELFRKYDSLFVSELGKEALFNMYMQALYSNTDEYIPNSASKINTIIPSKFDTDTNSFDFRYSTKQLDNEHWKLQVETPSGKTKITYFTQVLHLIDNEQVNLTESMIDPVTGVRIDPIVTDVATSIGKGITVGELIDKYRNIVGSRVQASVERVINSIIDIKEEELLENDNDRELYNKFSDKYYTKQNIEKVRNRMKSLLMESAANPTMIEYFENTIFDGTESEYSWNSPTIAGKFEQLFLSQFNKGVLKQKISGLKVSLVSSFGNDIVYDSTGKIIDYYERNNNPELYYNVDGSMKSGLKTRPLRWSTYPVQSNTFHIELVIMETALDEATNSPIKKGKVDTLKFDFTNEQLTSIVSQMYAALSDDKKKSLERQYGITLDTLVDTNNNDFVTVDLRSKLQRMWYQSVTNDIIGVTGKSIEERKAIISSLLEQYSTPDNVDSFNILMDNIINYSKNSKTKNDIEFGVNPTMNQGYLTPRLGVFVRSLPGKPIGDATPAEAIIPIHFAELHKIKRGDVVNKNNVSAEVWEDLMTMFGTRIPTQDKQSMTVFKVVDFLPLFMGDSGVFADDMVSLSGADFDIDSLYIIRKEHYVDSNTGNIRIYGQHDDIINDINDTTQNRINIAAALRTSLELITDKTDDVLELISQLDEILVDEQPNPNEVESYQSFDTDKLIDMFTNESDKLVELIKINNDIDMQEYYNFLNKEDVNFKDSYEIVLNNDAILTKLTDDLSVAKQELNKKKREVKSKQRQLSENISELRNELFEIETEYKNLVSQSFSINDEYTTLISNKQLFVDTISTESLNLTQLEALRTNLIGLNQLSKDDFNKIYDLVNKRHKVLADETKKEEYDEYLEQQGLINKEIEELAVEYLDALISSGDFNLLSSRLKNKLSNKNTVIGTVIDLLKKEDRPQYESFKDGVKNLKQLHQDNFDKSQVAQERKSIENDIAELLSQLSNKHDVALPSNHKQLEEVLQYRKAIISGIKTQLKTVSVNVTDKHNKLENIRTLRNQLKEHKQQQKELRELTKQERNKVNDIQSSINTHKAELRNKVLRQLKYPVTKEELIQFKENNGISFNQYVNNNMLVDINKALYLNAGVANMASTEVSLDSLHGTSSTDIGLSKLAMMLRGESNVFYDVNTMSGKMLLKDSNKTGDALIGIAAVANAVGGILLKSSNQVNDNSKFYTKGYNFKVSSDGKTIVYDMNKGEVQTRIMDDISTILSAATDNNKHNDGYKLGIDISNLGSYLVSLTNGGNMTDMTLMASQPILLSLTEISKARKQTISTTEAKTKVSISASKQLKNYALMLDTILSKEAKSKNTFANQVNNLRFDSEKVELTNDEILQYRNHIQNVINSLFQGLDIDREAYSNIASLLTPNEIEQISTVEGLDIDGELSTQTKPVLLGIAAFISSDSNKLAYNTINLALTQIAHKLNNSKNFKLFDSNSLNSKSLSKLTNNEKQLLQFYLVQQIDYLNHYDNVLKNRSSTILKIQQIVAIFKGINPSINDYDSIDNALKSFEVYPDNAKILKHLNKPLHERNVHDRLFITPTQKEFNEGDKDGMSEIDLLITEVPYISSVINSYYLIRLASSGFLVSETPIFRKIYNEIEANFSQYSTKRKEMTKKLRNQLRSYLFTTAYMTHLKNTGRVNEMLKLSDLLTSNPNNLKIKLNEMLNKHPQLTDNLFIQQLRRDESYKKANNISRYKEYLGYSKAQLSKDARTSTQFNNIFSVINIIVNNRQDIDESKVRDAFRDLLNHVDPEVRQIGKDLYNYLLVTTGFEMTNGSFLAYVPSELTKEYSDVTKRVEKALYANAYESTETVEGLHSLLGTTDIEGNFMQLFVSNPANKEVFNNISLKQFSMFDIDGDVIKETLKEIKESMTSTDASKHNFDLGKNDMLLTEEPKTVKYSNGNIVKFNKVIAMSGINSETSLPTRIAFNLVGLMGDSMIYPYDETNQLSKQEIIVKYLVESKQAKYNILNHETSFVNSSGETINYALLGFTAFFELAARDQESLDSIKAYITDIKSLIKDEIINYLKINNLNTLANQLDNDDAINEIYDTYLAIAQKSDTDKTYKYLRSNNENVNHFLQQYFYEFNKHFNNKIKQIRDDANEHYFSSLGTNSKQSFKDIRTQQKLLNKLTNGNIRFVGYSETTVNGKIALVPVYQVPKVIKLSNRYRRTNRDGEAYGSELMPTEMYRAVNYSPLEYYDKEGYEILPDNGSMFVTSVMYERVPPILSNLYLNLLSPKEHKSVILQQLNEIEKNSVKFNLSDADKKVLNDIRMFVYNINFTSVSKQPVFDEADITLGESMVNVLSTGGAEIYDNNDVLVQMNNASNSILVKDTPSLSVNHDDIVEGLSSLEENLKNEIITRVGNTNKPLEFINKSILPNDSLFKQALSKLKAGDKVYIKHENNYYLIESLGSKALIELSQYLPQLQFNNTEGFASLFSKIGITNTTTIEYDIWLGRSVDDNGRVSFNQSTMKDIVYRMTKVGDDTNPNLLSSYVLTEEQKGKEVTTSTEVVNLSKTLNESVTDYTKHNFSGITNNLVNPDDANDGSLYIKYNYTSSDISKLRAELIDTINNQTEPTIIVYDAQITLNNDVNNSLRNNPNVKLVPLLDPSHLTSYTTAMLFSSKLHEIAGKDKPVKSYNIQYVGYDNTVFVREGSYETIIETDTESGDTETKYARGFTKFNEDNKLKPSTKHSVIDNLNKLLNSDFSMEYLSSLTETDMSNRLVLLQRNQTILVKDSGLGIDITERQTEFMKLVENYNNMVSYFSTDLSKITKLLSDITKQTNIPINMAYLVAFKALPELNIPIMLDNIQEYREILELSTNNIINDKVNTNVIELLESTIDDFNRVYIQYSKMLNSALINTSLNIKNLSSSTLENQPIRTNKAITKTSDDKQTIFTITNSTIDELNSSENTVLTNKPTTKNTSLVSINEERNTLNTTHNSSLKSTLKYGGITIVGNSTNYKLNDNQSLLLNNPLTESVKARKNPTDYHVVHNSIIPYSNNNESTIKSIFDYLYTKYYDEFYYMGLGQQPQIVFDFDTSNNSNLSGNYDVTIETVKDKGTERISRIIVKPVTNNATKGVTDKAQVSNNPYVIDVITILNVSDKQSITSELEKLSIHPYNKSLNQTGTIPTGQQSYLQHVIIPSNDVSLNKNLSPFINGLPYLHLNNITSSTNNNSFEVYTQLLSKSMKSYNDILNQLSKESIKPNNLNMPSYFKTVNETQELTDEQIQTYKDVLSNYDKNPLLLLDTADVKQTIKTVITKELTLNGYTVNNTDIKSDNVLELLLALPNKELRDKVLDNVKGDELYKYLVNEFPSMSSVKLTKAGGISKVLDNIGKVMSNQFNDVVKGVSGKSYMFVTNNGYTRLITVNNDTVLTLRKPDIDDGKKC